MILLFDVENISRVTFSTLEAGRNFFNNKSSQSTVLCSRCIHWYLLMCLLSATYGSGMLDYNLTLRYRACTNMRAVHFGIEIYINTNHQSIFKTSEMKQAILADTGNLLFVKTMYTVCCIEYSLACGHVVPPCKVSFDLREQWNSQIPLKCSSAKWGWAENLQLQIPYSCCQIWVISVLMVSVLLKSRHLCNSNNYTSHHSH